jgi:hypothetical protein
LDWKYCAIFVLQVLLQYRTLRNYRTLMYVLPRLLEKLLFAAVLVSLYWGKVGWLTRVFHRMLIASVSLLDSVLIPGWFLPSEMVTGPASLSVHNWDGGSGQRRHLVLLHQTLLTTNP